LVRFRNNRQSGETVAAVVTAWLAASAKRRALDDTALIVGSRPAKSALVISMSLRFLQLVAQKGSGSVLSTPYRLSCSS
jgi:hypothetical protein